MIRVLIADDHPVVRRGLVQIVASESGMTVAGEAASGAEVLHLLEKGLPDVLTLDINMPGRSGLEVLHDIRQIYPRLPVLVLSVYPEDQLAVRALRAGASGYLTKDSAPEDLIMAIRTVVSGAKFLTPGAAGTLVNALLQHGQGLPHESLSDREYSVLCQIGSGHSVSEIATQMNLSVKTVSTYRTRLLEKMGLRTNADLTRYVIVHGLGMSDKH